MIIGKVSTKSDMWCENVLKGISEGNIKIDYWTNNWLPKKMQKDLRFISRINLLYKVIL